MRVFFNTGSNCPMVECKDDNVCVWPGSNLSDSKNEAKPIKGRCNVNSKSCEFSNDLYTRFGDPAKSNYRYYQFNPMCPEDL
jgi:hypothetical protein